LKNHKATQTDSTSCGVFICITAAYLIQHKRLPTKQEFCQDHVPECRLYIGAVLQHAGIYEQSQLAYYESQIRDREEKAAIDLTNDIDVASIYRLRAAHNTTSLSSSSSSSSSSSMSPTT